MATKDWNGFKKNGDTYIPNDSVARDAVDAITDGASINSFSDVETALEDKVDKVTGKDLSTNDYDNTAKGIVDNIQSNVIANTELIKDTVGWSGKNIAENLIKDTATFGSQTWTVNSDKSITVNGTDTSDHTRQCFYSVLPVGDYILSGCPSGGSATTYSIDFWVGSGAGQHDYGDGVKFSITEPNTTVNVYIDIHKNVNIDNKTFRFMVRKADILDDTYEPYFGSTAFPRSEQAVLGAKNFVKADGVSKTENGITYTVNSDGTVDVLTESSGATATTDLQFHAFLKNNTQYKMTGCPSNGSWDSYLLYIDGTQIAHTGSMVDTGDGTTFLINEDKEVPIRIFVASGTVITTPIKFSPMIRLASDTDPTYAPYAMTNKELTEKVQGIINAATNAADFAAFKTAIGNL